MKGADEYANIFNKEQHGRLVLHSSSHARGKTFQIWILPEGVKGDVDAPWCTKDAVEVYGIVGGQPGWTEEYGWLYEGKWVQDFEKLVEQRKEQIQKKSEEIEKRKAEEAEVERQRIATLLLDYTGHEEKP